MIVNNLTPKESKKLPRLSELYTDDTDDLESAIKKFVKKHGYEPLEINIINGYFCIKVEDPPK